MPKGTIERLNGTRVPFIFTDHGDTGSGCYCSSFQIGDGPILKSDTPIGSTANDRRLADLDAIRIAGGKPYADSIEFD